MLQHLDLFVEFGDGAATSTSGISLGQGRPDPRAAVQRLLPLNDYDQKVQRAELEYLARSVSARAALAENYVGALY